MKTLMVIDDETVTLKMTHMSLERAGYQVSSFSDPLSAIEAFKDNPMSYDLILSDRHMPRLSGECLVQKIRQLNHKVPLIILSGFIFEEQEERLFQLGVNKVLQKPISIKEMIKHIELLIGDLEGP